MSGSAAPSSQILMYSLQLGLQLADAGRRAPGLDPIDQADIGRQQKNSQDHFEPLRPHRTLPFGPARASRPPRPARRRRETALRRHWRRHPGPGAAAREQHVRDESAQQGQRHGSVRPRLLFPHQKRHGEKVVQQQQGQESDDHMHKNRKIPFHSRRFAEEFGPFAELPRNWQLFCILVCRD